MSIKLPICLLLICSAPAVAETEAQRIADATKVLTEMTQEEGKSVPAGPFQKSYCAVVIPSMKRAGFIIAGKYGRGFTSCRTAGGGWSAPSAIKVEGSGFGLGIGAEGTDIVMLVMTEKGMRGIMAIKFTFGDDASVAAGPVGRDAAANTDAALHADILSWSKSKGVFGGLALQGGTLQDDDEGNKEIYGQPQTGYAVLSGSVKPTGAATGLLELLTRCGGTKRQD
jgi:lipid-binding SYLF domain-containing protein